MFTRRTDASKIALAHLIAFLQQHQVPLIDCQQQTAHLASMGAAPVSRQAFRAHLQNTVYLPDLTWPTGRLSVSGSPIADVGI